MALNRSTMTALLAVLAVAGYQNREKLTEMLRQAQAGNRNPNAPGGTSQSGLGALGDLGASIGSVLSGGIGGILDQFKQSGQSDVAESWVKTGPNRDVSEEQLAQAIGPELLAQLQQQTGLSQQELLARLSRDLPSAIDDLTPEGHVPSEDEVERFGNSPRPA